MEWQKGEYRISTDFSRLDRGLIHRFLSEEAYWALGISRERVDRSIDHSLCFGLYTGDNQIGFARAVSDHAVFSYLADVFILPAYRGKGLGKWLVGTVLAHPDLQGMSRFLLGTYNAHTLYEQFGFRPLEKPEIFMSIERRPGDSG